MSIIKSLPVRRFFGRSIPYLWLTSRGFEKGEKHLSLLSLLKGLPGHKFLSSNIYFSRSPQRDGSVYRSDLTAPVIRDIMRCSARLGIIHSAIKCDVAKAAESTLEIFTKTINIYMPLDKAHEIKKTLTEAVSFLKRHGFTELADKYEKECSRLKLYTSRRKSAWQEQEFADEPQWTFDLRVLELDEMNMDDLYFDGCVKFIIGKDGKYSHPELWAIVQALSHHHDDINRLVGRQGATWDAPLTIRISRSNEDPATFWLHLYNKETETYSPLWGYNIVKYMPEVALRFLPDKSSD